ITKRAAIKSALLSAAFFAGLALTPAQAQELIVEKKVFEIPSFATQSGKTLKNVRVGWESYGTLNADRSNAILICHFFSGNSHAAGKYAASDAAPGYWDSIIGPGKAIDTNKYFVISSDTLVNLNTGDPKTTTTGPASIDPDTGKPYGMNFPIVTIRDFVEVQKKLAESLGISKFAMVSGASMGALQTYEWAATYPEMVGKAMPVIAAPDANADLIAWLDVWAAPIRLDPNWNNGDYYGKTPPLKGLAESLRVVTLHANHGDWANAAFGRKWAKEGADPAKSFDNSFQAETVLRGAGEARAKVSDANHFLYLVKANQLFVAGGGKIEDGLAKMKMPVLLINSPKDLVFADSAVQKTADALKAGGTPVTHVRLQGNRGHLDGVLTIKQAEGAIKDFLEK
ncbi:MAG: E22 family MetX-like putative esterase, partial [Beijerinckiaceae bacterium]